MTQHKLADILVTSWWRYSWFRLDAGLFGVHGDQSYIHHWISIPRPAVVL